MSPSRQPPTPSDDAPEDDLQWFELMAGRAVDEVRPGTRTEAAWLRAALLSYAPQPLPGAMPDPAERVQRLLDRAQRAGVLPPPKLARQRHGTVWQRLWRQLWQPWAGAGLGLAMSGLLAVVLWPHGGPEPADPLTGSAERGPAVQRLQDADPMARRQALLQALRGAGLDAQPYEQLGRPGVDLALPVPLSAAQARALQAQGLRPPGGPSLRIEILPLSGGAASGSAP
ncbi:MAG: hypothetical protein DI603_07625 [Roseateles depolymerans]|uniref:Uncharacterized protein n=1 Tax=Roseateles depolymerans TaxID=76731 RepID=A0A2W5DT94_9BURK|nr:MAG: hypothetical protein DI603_07625 [Roseateles depolymerans]